MSHPSVNDCNPSPTFDFLDTPLSQQESIRPEPRSARRAGSIEDTTVALSDRQVFFHYIRAISLRHLVFLMVEVTAAGFLQRFPSE